VASTGGTGGPDSGAGNPINVMTGNKYEREVDMPALPGVLGLEIIRHYNSVNSQPGRQNGAMGRGWRLSYETELFDMYGKIQILQADGGRIIFERDPRHTNLCSTRNPANGTMALVPQKNGANEYIWTWTNGRKLLFNSAGKLYKIKALTGEVVALDYDQRDVLQRVTDPYGRSLHLVYGDPQSKNQFHGVQFIDSPVGRFAYQYGSKPPRGRGLIDTRNLLALLVRAELPTGFEPDKPAHALTSRGTTTSRISRTYHHEDPRSPWLLTGISTETMGAGRKPIATRYSTYGYDIDGRAILSTHANNVDKVTLVTPEFGKTVVTNSLGQRTIYQHAVIGGNNRLLEVRGAGCALCGETNVRYRYNTAGQLTETIKLSDIGEPIVAQRTAFDKLGRITLISSIAYVSGKPKPAQWVTRYDYAGDSYSPNVIARPSVVPGKEVLTRFAYNAAGQPLSVTETGWVPNLDGSQAAGRIERTVGYRYSLINDRSLLTEIDGPLPNGKSNSPADSDITVIEYDNHDNSWVPSTPQLHPSGIAKYAPAMRRAGIVTRIIAPGNFITEVLERDQAQRPVKIRTNDSGVVQVATVTNNWRGAPLRIDLSAGALRRQMEFDYTATGQISAITAPGKLRTTFQYDQAGRLTRTILPDGSGILTAQDTEDRMQNVARFLDAATPTSDNLPTTNFFYDRPIDKPSRLSRIGDALGVSAHYRYTDTGQIATITNALGIAKKFSYRADGLLSQRADADGTPDAASVHTLYDTAGQATTITAANGVKTRRVYDDFGQKVLEADPDHGAKLLRHDAAGRVIASIDETLVATRYTFDHADRLIAAGSDKRTDLIQYRYRGRQLTTVTSTPDGNPKHATERVEYERDALGRVIKETQWIASVTPQSDSASAGVRFVTASSYDEAGRLVAQTLPDGHRLSYRYAAANGNNAHSAVRPGQLIAILFDDRIVVNDIEQTIAGGFTGYTMGNGVRQQIKLDRKGRIEQLQALPGPQSGWWGYFPEWFSTHKSVTAPLYKQINGYDTSGRIVTTDRWDLSERSEKEVHKRTERYEYDAVNRLVGITRDGKFETTYQYDKGGNRIGETLVSQHVGKAHSMLSGPNYIDRTFHYGANSNRLLTIAQNVTFNSSNSAVQPRSTPQGSMNGPGESLRSAWIYHPTGVQLAQLSWKEQGSSSNRRIVYNAAKRPVAVYDNDQLIARYHYNSWGERIAKTVYPLKRTVIEVGYSSTATQGDTVYSLYSDQRLAAETDANGQVTAHYVYLYGKPVAKIQIGANGSVMQRLWKTVSMSTASNASNAAFTIYAVISDHLGTPQQVIDENQQVVWKAETTPFGQAHVTHAAITSANAKPFRMNLRLPGQVFDEETKLNYNYLREYDPEIGRYTTADQTDSGGGTNPYIYVSNNPLTNLDPLGLYQIDVHYYMTFFLAITAGVDVDIARQIALATQYIDDNPVTRPMKNGESFFEYWDSVLINKPALERYHFTQYGYDDSRNTAEALFHLYTNLDLESYITRRIKNPNNPQLHRLLAASKYAKTDPDANCRTSIQLFGEYLHAFEDTFAHRNYSNDPYSPTILNLGFGHAAGGESPDYTYNHIGSYLGIPFPWSVNEDRTLQMEKEVFSKMKFFSNPGNPQEGSIITIMTTLEKFNKFQANDGSENFAAKIAILNDALKYLGYKNIDMVYQSKKHGYVLEDAASYRAQALNSLKPGNYPGTILPSGTLDLKERKR
jgi:RHS repeat-associated protein